MESWQAELLKIGATAIASFFLGWGSHWFRSRERKEERAAEFEDYLKKREIEKAQEQEKLREAEKLTTLFIEHRRHKISPETFNEFKERLLSQVDEDELEARSIEEISEAEGELYEIAWHDRHKLLKELVKSGRQTVDPEIWRKALKAAKEVERKYGKEKLEPRDDVDWGILLGRLAALRWVLDDEWDNFDT